MYRPTTSALPTDARHRRIGVRSGGASARSARTLLFVVLAATLTACVRTPRPTITINPENRLRTEISPVLSARIVPNQFPVTEVVLEFGRRPSTANPVEIVYNSTPASYNLRRQVSANLPTSQPFDVSFSLVAPPPAEFAVGEVIDYQFKVTHLSANNSPLVFWSERRSFRIQRASGGGAGGNPGSGSIGSGGGGVRVENPSTPNLAPNVAAPYVLTRPLTGEVVATPDGGMMRLNSFFCAALSSTPNRVASVNVPDLVWGVLGSDIEAATVAFDVQLIDADSNAVLSTLNLPQGFPANTPLVQTENYPGRLSTLRVILNPRFQIGSAIQTFEGCFTEPGSAQSLDPRLLVRVDPDNRIDEGERENDNELPL
jgi:hypothetical protein